MMKVLRYVGVAAAAVFFFASSAGAMIESTAGLRALSDTAARAGAAVAIRGVVTFANRESGDLYIQDETGGLAVRQESVRALAAVPAVGTLVEIGGVSHEGLFVPVLTGGRDEIRLREVGRAALPQAVVLGSADLESGAFDAQRVAVRGVMRSVRREGKDLRMELGTRVGRTTIIVPGAGGQVRGELLHARVRAEGVLRAIANSRRQWVGNMLIVPRVEDIVIEEAAPADLFAVPESSVGELSRVANPGSDARPVRVRGVVTFFHGGYRFFLRCEGGTLEVVSMAGWPGTVAPGDRVEAVGYPLLVRKRVVLHDSVARVLERGDAPEPRSLTVQQVLTDDINSELVSIEGRLVQVTQRTGKPVLFVESGGQIVEAVYPLNDSSGAFARIAALPTGAQLRMTGITDVQGAMRLDGSVSADFFSLLFRAPEDVVILLPPPYWTTARLLAAVGILAATVALFAIWSAMLRRRVLKQTAIIRANAKSEAVWEERSRIAQDIHDDVGAALTQISLLGEIGRRAGASPETMTNQLGKVVAKARDAVRALDEIVWTVNPVNDSLDQAASYFCHTVQDLLRETPIRCRLQVDDDLPPRKLGAKVRHNLFLAIKEAVNNAVKHSGATGLRFSLAHRDGNLVARVEDDGRGFDAGNVDRSRNGLTNMERRLADAGGFTKLDTAPGKGTAIAFSVPV